MPVDGDRVVWHVDSAAGKALIDAVAAVRLAKPVALHLTLARETRPALFDHSILMALLCAHLVRESGAWKICQESVEVPAAS